MNKTNQDAQGARPMRKKATSADLLGSNNEIARKLREYYKELVSDDVPDRFKELLSRLDSAEPVANRLGAEGEGATGPEATRTKAEG